MKKQLLNQILIFFLLFSLLSSVFIPSVTTASDWIIDGDTVYIDDENAYLSATPHTIIQDTWVTFQLRSKNYEGDVDACWLFDTTNCKPTKPVYYKIGDGDWTELTKEFTVETIDFENMTKAYLLENINIQKDVDYYLKCFVDIKFNTSGKYWWGVKPSALDWANGYYIDPWWNNSWEYYRTLTINPTYIDADLTNFPVLVNVSAAISAKCDSGNSIRFLNIDNTTEYYYEIEGTWNAASYNFVWVNITSISSSADTRFLMYYGNSGASDNQSPTNVWDSGYKLVSHLNTSDSTTLIVDSTSNRNNGTKLANAEPSQATGIIGYGQNYDGNNDNISYSNIGDTFWGFEAWIKPAAEINSGSSIAGAINIDKNRFLLYSAFGASTGLLEDETFSLQKSTGGDTRVGITETITASWHLLSVSWDDNEFQIYLDGTNLTEITSGATPQQTMSDLILGNFSATYPVQDMDVDEFRVSIVKRNDSWMKAIFHNGNQTTGFLTIGLELMNTSIITNATTGIGLTNATARGFINDVAFSGNYNYGFWIGRTTPVNGDNADQNVTGASTIAAGSNFSYNVLSLSEGTLYYDKAWVSNATFFGTGSEVEFYTKCGVPTGFTATASGCNVALAWTKGAGAVRTTVVRKVDSYPTSQTDGTVVYNNTASSYSDTTGGGSHQYYRAWSWAGDKHSDANASANVIVPPCPPTGVGGAVLVNTTLNITWTIGTGAATTLIVRKSDSSPTTVTDGTVMYNSTGTHYIATDLTGNYYYRLWSYANETYSSSVALDFGALVVSCYDEETNGSLYFDVFVSNQSGSQTYESRNNTNPLIINVADNLPIDDQVSIHVSAASNYSDKTETFTGYDGDENTTVTYVVLLQPPESKALTNVTCRNASASTNSYPAFTLDDDVITILANAADEFSQITVNYTHYEYESRTYYRDLTTNHVFVINAYLPSADDKILCRITVIDEISQAVDDAYVEIMRNINGSWAIIASRYTDGNGQVDVFLVDGVLYKFIISKTDYVTEYADWTPSADAPTHTFQLEAEELEPDEDLYFDDYITFNGYTNFTANMLYVNYTDVLNETINTAIYIYEYNYSDYTNTLIYSDTRSANYDFQISTSINSSNAHTVVLYVNHTNFGFVTRTIYFEGNITTITTPARGESLLTLNYKSNPFGWTNTITWIILLIIYFNYGQRDAGIGLIFSGVFLLFINSYVGFTDVATTAAGGGIPILHIVVGIIAVIRAERKQVIT